MIVGFGIGLWAILSFGAILLRAPTDLSGRWKLHSGDPSRPSGEMIIDQSGRFFTVTLEGRTASLKLLKDEVTRATAVDALHMELAGEGLQLALDGPADGEELRVRASGTVQGEWTANLSDATYPRRRTPAAALSRKAAALTEQSPASTRPAAIEVSSDSAMSSGNP
jgi:hypothetical protein